jgi:hypothetical protein
MLRRLMLVTSAATIVLFWGGRGASAGGAVFNFTDEDGDRIEVGEQPVRPGQILTAHTSFSPNIGGMGGIGDGPYFVYLVRGSRVVPPAALPPTAIELGRLEIVQEPFSPVARITFIVPRVPTGEYSLSVCNHPCTVDGLGVYVRGRGKGQGRSTPPHVRSENRSSFEPHATERRAPRAIVDR